MRSLLIQATLACGILAVPGFVTAQENPQGPERAKALEVLRRAAEAAERIEPTDPNLFAWERPAVLQAIGKATVDAGDRETGLAMIRRAEELSAGAPEISGIWPWLAQTYAAVGQYEEARRYANKSPQGGSDLGRLAEIQWEAGDKEEFSRTLATLQTLTEAETYLVPDRRTFDRVKLARFRIRAGEIPKAIEILESVDYGDEYAEHYEINILCTSIIPALVEVGETGVEAAGRMVDRARAARDRIEPAGEAGPQSAMLAYVEALIGRTDEALATADAIATPADKSQARAWIVEARIGRGDLEGAERAARSIDPDAPDRPIALAGLADAQHAEGRDEAAEATLRDATAAAEADPTAGRSIALTRVAKSWVELGNATEAARIADLIADPAVRAETFLLAAEAEAKAGREPVAADDFDRASKAADSIEANTGRAEVLRKLAEARTQLGEEAEALELLRKAVAATDTIGNPFLRAQAVAPIVRAQLTAGDRKAARATAAAVVESAEVIEHDDAPSHFFASGFAFQGLAHAQADAGDPDAALEWAERLPGPIDRALALRGVGMGIARIPLESP